MLTLSIGRLVTEDTISVGTNITVQKMGFIKKDVERDARGGKRYKEIVANLV